MNFNRDMQLLSGKFRWVTSKSGSGSKAGRRRFCFSL